MGAQNHQPTSRVFTGISAWLSQRLGEGNILIQQANNHLEDAVILGMEKLHVSDFAASLAGSASDHLVLTMERLVASEAVLPRIDQAFTRLLETAEVERYRGNPLAPQLKSFELKRQFAGVLVKPGVNDRMWDEVETHIAETNILETLKWEASEFRRLVEPTRLFRETISQCLTVAREQGAPAFVDAVESNTIPVRQYGAQVLSLWNGLNAMFLYSALMMTELFYKMNAYPSLLDFTPPRGRTAA